MSANKLPVADGDSFCAKGGNVRSGGLIRQAKPFAGNLSTSPFRSLIFLLQVGRRRFKVNFTIMSNAASEPSSSASDLLKNSSLYREFQAEREEILRHKWIESEKAGRDIGFEQALTDWIIKHRSTWRKNRQSQTN
jgi:hypothetical protein